LRNVAQRKYSMNEFSKLRKSARKQAVEAGVIRKVAAETGKHKTSVSRTLAGITKCPDETVVVALRRAIEDLGIDCAEVVRCA
jgi:hypothetical protein